MNGEIKILLGPVALVDQLEVFFPLHFGVIVIENFVVSSLFEETFVKYLKEEPKRPSRQGRTEHDKEQLDRQIARATLAIAPQISILVVANVSVVARPTRDRVFEEGDDHQ